MQSLYKLISLIFAKFPNHTKWFFWMIIALLFKGGFFLYKTSIEENPFINTIQKGTFALVAGDTHSYIDPIENYLLTGIYTSELAEDYRMPGYGIPYFVLRHFLNTANAMNAIVLFQLLLSAISVYVLALLALVVFKNPNYFYITFFTYAISTYVSLYDHLLITESFCTSSLIISSYLIFSSNNAYIKLILSGLFLTWCIFLKPVTAPLLVAFVLYLILKSVSNRTSVIKTGVMSLIFLTPFIIIDGAWVFRNYKLYNRIIPLTKSLYYPTTENSFVGSLYTFINAYGGSIVAWEPGADITFFLQAPNIPKKKLEVLPPKNIYTSKFNYDSLVVVKNLIRELSNPDIKPELKSVYEKEVIDKLETYTISIKEEKPFLFYLSSRIKTLKTFFLHSGTYNLFHKSAQDLGIPALIFKIFSSLLFVTVVTFGFPGSVYILISGFRNVDFLLISSIGLYIALVFPIMFKLDEFRYFVPGYPFFLISAIYFIFICGQIIRIRFSR